jgi:predicted regulator of Ras-like GTPase activity (Roadblock/LC7/MglB family)
MTDHHPYSDNNRWFEHLSQHPHIEAVLLFSSQGQLLQSSIPFGSNHDTLASMLQSLEVLAQTLSAEFKVGVTSLVHLITEGSHVLVLPLLQSTYYLVALVDRAGPLMLVTVDLQRTVAKLTAADIAAVETSPISGFSDLDAASLIEAVQEWLRRPPVDRSDFTNDG